MWPILGVHHVSSQSSRNSIKSEEKGPRVRTIGVAGLNTTNYAEDQSNQDNQVDEFGRSRRDDSRLSLVYRVKETTEQADSGKLKWGQADVLEDCGADVKAEIIRLTDCCKLHTWPDDSYEAEDDQEIPACASTKSVVDGEEGSNCQTRDIDDDFGDRDAIAIIESHSE